MRIPDPASMAKQLSNTGGSNILLLAHLVAVIQRGRRLAKGPSLEGEGGALQAGHGDGAVPQSRGSVLLA